MIIEDIGATGGTAVSGHDAIHGENVDGGLRLDNTTIRKISDMAIHGEPFAGAGFTNFTGLEIVNGSLLEDSNRYHLAGLGDDNNEAMVRIRGINGTVTVTDSILRRGGELLDLSTSSGASDTLALTAQNTDFHDSFKGFTGSAAGLACINIKVRGPTDATIHIGDPAEASTALGNSFTGCATVGIAVKHDDSSATGQIDAIISRNDLDNESSLPSFPHPFGFGNFPTTSLLVRQRGNSSSTLNAIISHNDLSLPSLAEGQIGGITVLFDGVAGGTTAGTGQVRISDNIIDRPISAKSIFVFAENNTAANVLIEDNTIGEGNFDHPELGTSRGPAQSAEVRTQENGKMQATVRGHFFPLHDDVFEEPGNGSFRARTIGNGVGGGSDVLCLSMECVQTVPGTCDAGLNNTSDEGYRVREGGGTLVVSQGFSSSTVIATVLDDNENRGGGGNPTLSPPTVNFVATSPSTTGTACTLPSGGIF